MRSVLRFPRRVRRVEAAKATPETCPSPLPETPLTPRTDALEAYRSALRDFACEMLERAAALDAMRREAVGHAPFDLVTLCLPGGRKNCRQIAEKLLTGAELYPALQQALSACRDSLFPLLAVARVLDSLEATHGAELAAIAAERLTVMDRLTKEARLD